MKKWIITGFVIASALNLWAQAPEMFRYQGRLVDGTNLVNAIVPMSFKLYDALSSVNKLYEDSSSILVVDGLYSTYIGDSTVFGSLTNAMTNAAVYLELTVNGETLSPRERLVSVPYALNFRKLDAVIQKISSAGGVTAYIPAADTDGARGTVLQTALKELADNDTLIITAGKYLITNFNGNGTAAASSLGKSVSGVSFIGVGSPLIYCNDNGAQNTYLPFHMVACKDILWDGINTRVQVYSNGVAGVFSYALSVSLCTNVTIRNSTFQQEIYGVNRPGDKVIAGVNGAANIVFENCNIVSLAIGGGNINSFLAGHDNGGNGFTFKNCAFIGNAKKFDVGSSGVIHKYIGENLCTVRFYETNYTCNSVDSLKLVGAKQARGLILPYNRDLLTDAMCYLSNKDAVPFAGYAYETVHIFGATVTHQNNHPSFGYLHTLPPNVTKVDLLGVMCNGQNADLGANGFATNCIIYFSQSALNAGGAHAIGNSRSFVVPINSIGVSPYGVNWGLIGDGVTPLATFTNVSAFSAGAYNVPRITLNNTSGSTITNFGATIRFRFTLN